MTVRSEVNEIKTYFYSHVVNDYLPYKDVEGGL